MKALPELSPKAFEDYVRDWLIASGVRLDEFTTTRLEKIDGAGGVYEIDVLVRLSFFGGANLTILVECKHHKNPIKRDVIMVLESKIRDTKAHKGMIFSTCDFQSGALTFAKAHGIATLRVTDAGMEYMTRSFAPRAIAPVPNKCIAWMCEPTDQGYSMTIVSRNEGDALRKWLASK
jgi:restriction system protein